jgi:hypothetical protein
MITEERTPPITEGCSRMMTFLSDFATAIPDGVVPAMIIF